MVDRSTAGALGAPFEMDVERGKIHELARAIRASDPAYFTGDHPVVPPTFLTTTFFWEALVAGSNPWALVKMDQKRGLHAEQEYVFYGPPPHAGDRLSCQSRIAEIYEKEGRRGGTLTFAVMVTEFRDASGRLVAEARLTGVETGDVPVQASPAPRPSPPLPPSPAARERGEPDASFSPSPAERERGPGGEGRGEDDEAPCPLVLGPLTRTDFVRYQGASGDMNPVHHDETFARAAGYDAPLGVGMFAAGALAAWAARWLGAENVRRTKMRWKEPVWPGDVLTCSGKVGRRYVESGERRVDVDLVCTRQGGGVAVTGWMTFVVPE